MEITTSLKQTLKRLKLSGLLMTLPERVAYAKKTKLAELDFLELVLHDEVERRDHKNLALRLGQAGFEEEHLFEGFDWDAPVTFDRDRVRDLFSLGFLERHEDAIFMGPVGVGKTFLAGALGHAACRAGHRVLFLRADRMFHQLHQARADLSTEKVFRRLLAPDLLILCCPGEGRLQPLQEVVIEGIAMPPLHLDEGHGAFTAERDSGRILRHLQPPTPVSGSTVLYRNLVFLGFP